MAETAQPQRFDVLIRNGRVMDGTGGRRPPLDPGRVFY